LAITLVLRILASLLVSRPEPITAPTQPTTFAAFDADSRDARHDESSVAPMKAVLDAGALVAIDQRDRHVGAMLALLQHQGVPLHTSVAAVAQVWRDGREQALLARVLAGVKVVGLSPGTRGRSASSWRRRVRAASSTPTSRCSLAMEIVS